MISLVWLERSPEQVVCRVAPSSKLQNILSWAGLVVSLLLGLGVASLLPVDSGKVKLLLGLLLGIGPGVANAVFLTKTGLGNSPESKGMAERVDHAVAEWHATLRSALPEDEDEPTSRD